MKFLVTLILFSSITKTTLAQEIKWQVTINTDQASVNERRSTDYFERLKGAMEEFLNTRKWTNDQFASEERISATLMLTVTRATSQGDVSATATIQALRPVYGTSYESLVMRAFDRNFDFAYLPENQLFYNENAFLDNLTSLMAYYSYLTLMLDYDSFGKMGGNPYLTKLQNLVQNANRTGGGWDGTQSNVRNRATLLENLQNPQFLPFREGFYTYHRLVLDDFQNKTSEGRQQLLTYLEALKQIALIKPSSPLLLLFFDTKYEELFQLFAEAPTSDRKKAYDLLSYLDPPHTEVYRKLNK
jgi:hypothetical protein